jgi:hypothetical protein
VRGLGAGQMQVQVLQHTFHSAARTCIQHHSSRPPMTVLCTENNAPVVLCAAQLQWPGLGQVNCAPRAQTLRPSCRSASGLC